MNTGKSVLYCIDSKGVALPWAIHSIQSLRRNGDYDIFVASPSNPNIDGTIWIDANKYIERFRFERIMVLRYHRGSCDPMILFRLAIPSIEELGEYDRVLYLDSDTEIFHPIDEIFDISKNNFDMAGVKDFNGFCKKSCERLRMFYRDHRISCRNSRYRLDNDIYVNSGVLMFYPMNIMQRHNYSEKVRLLLELMVRRRLFWDQDIINLGFKINIIDSKWNALMDMKRNTIPRNAVVGHFIGKSKLKKYPPDWKFGER